MSDSGAPWWADVQHLRPRDDAAGPSTPRRFRGDAAPADARSARRSADSGPSHRSADSAAGPSHRSADSAYPAPGRFARRDADLPLTEDAAVATLEHEVPVRPDPADTAWLEALWSDAPAAEPATDDAPAPKPSPVWDAALEEAFARTPSWATEDDERLLPKGANRIENGRRTIEIRGQVDRMAGFTAPAETTVATRTGRRRPSRSAAERLAGRPDRIAMWAFLLGVLLILIAALSAPGAPAA